MTEINEETNQSTENKNESIKSISHEEQTDKTDWQKMSLFDKICYILIYPVFIIGKSLVFLFTGALGVVAAFTDEMSRGKRVLCFIMGVVSIVAIVFVILGLNWIFDTYR